MRLIIALFCLFIAATGLTKAQDTIALNGQPKWEKAFDMADHCLFYEETADQPLTFTEIKKAVFIPYRKELRELEYSNRPLIIQWIKFAICNVSKTDTIDLRLDASAHYYTRLYDRQKIIGLGGAYQTGLPTLWRYGMSLLIPPHTTIVYLLRTEDRKDQLIPPHILLKTPYVAVKEGTLDIYGDRYLFLLLARLCGCLFFINLYAVYQYYLYRDIAFIWYICYTASALFMGLFWMDIRLQLMLFSPFIRDIIFSICILLIPALYALFIGQLLQFSRYFKKGWVLIKVLIGIAVLQMVIEFLEVHNGWFIFNKNYYSILTSVFPTLALNFVLLVLTAKSKEPVKWFLFGGLVSMLLLWFLPFTRIFYHLPYKSHEFFVIIIFLPAFFLLGLTIEAIFFSFALSYRAKLILIEKNTLQATYALQLQNELAVKTNELQIQNSISEAQKIKQVETDFEHRIAETEMTALRAQMNPHFIFNCLNSIKLYTLENDSQTASEYLTVFSQLIRLVLENSQSEKVTLQKELETLRLYIQLEAMRFKNKVRYQINVDPAIDQQFTDIPPLLLQPYVENAIWHGLMHKKEGGIIKIDVAQPSEHLLHIEITDNGVGRELAAAYKSKSATRQKSFGLKITSERIDIINQLYEMEADVKIIDLKDSMNNAIGTKVTIQIPL
ncbi:histidine kinase [Mucilaginibacter sp. RB4R14]|uniref:sensor histidine kinase n=1 Tax=Mucilaginibacter aurantiaciroseus TaxID=2949308 RepID=UPI002091525B|nr:histidine kinase [Mucilaginibacter aurantiaciroseus]MCO5935896.1 histidine kinase [Mucilaginibacter aurantiaciroseus]